MPGARRPANAHTGPTPREPRSPLTRLALPVFIPSLVWSTGYGALDPVVVLAALALGMSQSSASALAVSSNLWSLARQAYVAESVPPHWRARGMSMLGGMLRLGKMVGPGAGAAALDPVLAQARPVRERADRRSVLLLATCVLVLALVRTNRQVVIPLLGAHLGVSNELISATFAISTLLDVAVFYPSGRITDRYGRGTALIPTLLAMGVGFCLLATVTSTAWFIAAACLVGFGNGLGAGIVMTIGADLSPDVDRSKFLGVWQSLSTIGTVVGPFLVSAIVAVSDVEWATAITRILGLAGAAWSWFWVPVAYRRIGIDERGRGLRPQGLS